MDPCQASLLPFRFVDVTVPLNAVPPSEEIVKEFPVITPLTRLPDEVSPTESGHRPSGSNRRHDLRERSSDIVAKPG